LKQDVIKIIKASKKNGWVMEPQAKMILRLYGLKTTHFYWVKHSRDLLKKAHDIGYPIVMKVVSKQIIHKTESDGVSIGITDDERLTKDFEKMISLPGFDGVIIEEMARGFEMIVGSKYNDQFGTVIMVGLGGTAVELYKDVAIRLAPIKKSEALRMVLSLKAAPLLQGYRGAEPIHLEALSNLIEQFSKMASGLSDTIASIDCNPVFCSAKHAVIADARFMF
jgi:hypothetical protein